MQSTPSTAPRSVSLTSHVAAFATVPDPRRLASVRYPLPAILALAVAAILSNHVSVLAISEWAARQTEATLTVLGFPASQTPRQSKLQRLFAKLDGMALGQILAAAIASATVSDDVVLQRVSPSTARPSGGAWPLPGVGARSMP